MFITSVVPACVWCLRAHGDADAVLWYQGSVAHIDNRHATDLQLLKVLSTQRLMRLDYETFEQATGGCNELFKWRRCVVVGTATAGDRGYQDET